MVFIYKDKRKDFERAVDQAISDAEQEFAETGKTIDANEVFSELEKKYFLQVIL